MLFINPLSLSVYLCLSPPPLFQIPMPGNVARACFGLNQPMQVSMVKGPQQHKLISLVTEKLWRDF